MTSIIDILKDTAEFHVSGSNVKCEFNIQKNLWPIECDPGQISQVIGNLIINSKEAMPNGGTIEVTAENCPLLKNKPLPLDPGNYIRLTVKDYGCGISEENIVKIFDPYFSTKHRGTQKGMGLGLSTVHSIIKRHGGYISCESILKRSTCFTLYLPANDQMEAKPMKKTHSRGRNQKGRILLMDDEEIIRGVGGEIIKHLGFDVDYATDGEEAIELYQTAIEENDPFDAVIIDLTIPGGMGGMEAIEKLLEIDPDVKGIVSSGYSNDPVMSNYKDYGFVNVVAKPYKIEELEEVLRSVVLSA